MSEANQNCEVCIAISQKKGMAIYEDDEVVAMIDENPAAFGHLAVMPKNHYPIIEQVPDHTINHLFQIANKLSVVLFESAEIQGTNILINNGIAAGQDLAHFMVNIIPRKEGDGINFLWQPKQLSEEEMSTVELVLKENAQGIGNFEMKKKEEDYFEASPEVIESKIRKKKPAVVQESETKPAEKLTSSPEESKNNEELEEEEENYLIKHLKRIA